MKKLALGLALSLVFSITKGQGKADPLGTWNILNIRGKITGEWEFFLEGQLRSIAFYNKFFYYEGPKGGINYNLSKDYSLTLGSGSYNTYRDGGNFVLPMRTREIRLWEQFVAKQSYRALKLEHRYRVEQRFLNTGYRNRFRYRLAAMIPFKGSEIKKGVLYGFLYGEVFVPIRNPITKGTGYLPALGINLPGIL